MIEFQLDTVSGVATYLQLVQQVHDALRLGLLEPGDQLPTAQQVVAKLAINPNTVLKAYRDLEREGLVRGRPGQGTFVIRSLPGIDQATQGRFVAAMTDLLRSARSAGLAPRRHRGDLPDRGPQLLRGGCRVTAVIEASGLGKRYGRRWALADCTVTVPAGRVTGLVGPNGAGKTTLLQLAAGLLTPDAGTIRVLGERPAVTPAQLARVGFVAQDAPVYAGLSVAGHLRMGALAQPRLGQRAGRAPHQPARP